MLILLLMNYSGIRWMQFLISPPINREFGLLENLQLALILVMAITCFKGVLRKTQWLEKIGFSLLTLFSVFVFLEEIDYGLHFYEYFYKGGVENKEMVRNFHNQGNNNFWFRQGTYAVVILTFVVLPLLASKIKVPLIQDAAPRKMAIATVGVYLLISQIARFMPSWGFPVNPSLWGNHQEFEELVIYYLFLLYLLDWVHRKPALRLSFKKAD